MNEKKSYSAPDIIAEEQMEQTALQSCWVTQEGNFTTDLACGIPGEKNENSFTLPATCTILYEDTKQPEPFS